MIKILTSSRNGSALHTLACRITPEAEQIANVANYLQPLIVSIKTSIKDFETYTGDQTANPYTKELAAYNIEMSNYYLWLRDFVSVQRHSPDAAVTKAAVQLWPVFERHGLTIHSKGYARKSSDLRALLNDLSNNSLQQTITTLGIRAWIDRLSTVLTAFNNCFMQRAALGKQTDASKTKASTENIVKYLTMLLSNLDLVEETSKDIAILTRLKTINTIVEQYNSQLRAARTRGKSTKDEENDTIKE